ncbi:MAG TPA: DUF58 domain-containing protein [Burkholderiaceae bacterium]|jgi:uncharacterized protein (DUF58 family)|nr:DUF58 domain-containing protein [Burkholderiaceae bacterium]
MYAALRELFCEQLDKWLYRLRGAESGEIFLNQRRVFIIPSRAGLAFCLMLAALFIGAVNYNLGLGFALVFLLAGCALMDMYMTFRNLAHLYLVPGRAQAVFAGEEARFELHLVNRSKHSRYAIWLAFIGNGLPDIEQAVDVPDNGSCSAVLATTAKRRGWMEAPRVRLQTRFPLGLLRAWSYWQPSTKVLVYPQPEENAPPLLLAGTRQEDGQGYSGRDDFAGIRAYQSGDSVNRLAWRQIARISAAAGETLVTKHFEGGSASELCIDWASLPHYLDIETKLSRMTRWVIEAEARGLVYAFRLGDAVFPAALGPAHREACLRALALYREAA